MISRKTSKHKLLGLGLAAALVFGGAGAAFAAPAVVDTPLNVRSGAGTNYRVVDVARRGEIVDVDYCRGNWCRISRRGPDGWVSARYLSRGDNRFYDDRYYDDDFYIERPRRVWRHHHRHHRPDFSACIGGANARFCIYD